MTHSISTRLLVRCLIGLVLILATSTVARADSEPWIQFCNESQTVDAHTLLAVPVTSRLIPGERACATSATNTNETLVLSVEACREITVLQFLDADGDGTGSLLVGQVEFCPNAFDDDDGCDDFGITVFGAADEFRSGLSPSYVRVKSAGTSDSDLIRWEIRCIGQAR